MLSVHKKVIYKLEQIFLDKTQEEGFLLGSKACLEQLEYCYQIPAVRASQYFYTPDVNVANQVIKNWADQEICFCGFIHSHVVDKRELSQNDIEFAIGLYMAYQLPVMWFGLGIVEKKSVSFLFYSVTEREGKVQMEEVDWRII